MNKLLLTSMLTAAVSGLIITSASADVVDIKMAAAFEKCGDIAMQYSENHSIAFTNSACSPTEVGLALSYIRLHCE